MVATQTNLIIKITTKIKYSSLQEILSAHDESILILSLSKEIFQSISIVKLLSTNWTIKNMLHVLVEDIYFQKQQILHILDALSQNSQMRSLGIYG